MNINIQSYYVPGYHRISFCREERCALFVVESALYNLGWLEHMADDDDSTGVLAIGLPDVTSENSAQLWKKSGLYHNNPAVMWEGEILIHQFGVEQITIIRLPSSFGSPPISD